MKIVIRKKKSKNNLKTHVKMSICINDNNKKQCLWKFSNVRQNIFTKNYFPVKNKNFFLLSTYLPIFYKNKLKELSHSSCY